MTVIDLSCSGTLVLDRLKDGTLLAVQDLGSGSRTKWVRAQCPVCGWTGEITLTRARDGRRCGSKPGDN